MRRLLLALLLGLMASPSQADEMFYRALGNADLLAVSETTGATRTVLRGTEYTLGQQYGLTRFNHAGSNGQAFRNPKWPSRPGVAGGAACPRAGFSPTRRDGHRNRR